jgi:hypothetical protein
MVLSGFTIENGYAVILALGIGFYAAVGSGVLVQNGVTFYQVRESRCISARPPYPASSRYAELYESGSWKYANHR